VFMQPFLPHFGKVYFAQAVSHGLEVCVQQWNHLALHPTQLLIMNNRGRTFTRMIWNLCQPTFTLGRLHLEGNSSKPCAVTLTF
jgi:hypothetical protein